MLLTVAALSVLFTVANIADGNALWAAIQAAAAVAFLALHLDERKAG